MLTEADNQLLTRTGPGTPMGDLFRRYWLPVLQSDELERDGAPVRVKLLGERLVAFRDTGGRVGLMDEFCAHRGVSLWFGRNEEHGLRCPYHGWKYDATGQCVEVPSEPAENGFCRKIKLASYPCLERADLVWAYLGPPALQPPPPELAWVPLPPAQRFVSKRVQDCNYMQALEGDLDSSHSGVLHAGALDRDPLFAGAKGNDYVVQHHAPVFEVVEFEGGLLLGARRQVDGGRSYWRITPWIAPTFTVVPPRGLHPFAAHVWVPIDDETCWTWCINFHPHRALTESEVAAMQNGGGIHAKLVPGTFTTLANRRNDYLIDRAAQKAGLNASGVDGVGMQDAAVQESMGAVPDRTREHLVSTDNAIIMVRRRLLTLAKANREGRALPGLTPRSQCVRSAEIELPDGVPFVEGARDGMFEAAAD